MQHHPLVQALSRLGALVFLALFLFEGIGPSLRTGRSIGQFFGESLGGTFLSGGFISKLVVGIGAFLGGLGGLSLFVVVGALLGSAAGAIAVRYIVKPSPRNQAGNGERP